MAETTMPAAEAEVVATGSDEQVSYELAFHVLPTVAEGEVAGVFESLKEAITTKSGVLGEHEAPERIDLAYDIVENIGGKHKKYHSAYFGWVRFTTTPELVEALKAEIDAKSEILRTLLIRLTRAEEAQTFFYHQARKEKKTVVVGEEEAPVSDATIATKTEDEKSAEVSESELDESIEKITTEGTEGEKTETEEEKK